MILNKHIFRGFHIYEQGDKVITLDGKKIRGYWLYGYLLKTKFCTRKTFIRYFPNQDDEFIDDTVIPETVGQWITFDKNGNDVFEGDKVWVDGYSEGFPIYMLEQFYKTILVDARIEVYGNIWEVADEQK